MTRTLTLAIICLLTTVLAYGTSITLFRAHTQGDSVRLEWNAPNEQGISSYEVYRQDYPADDFDKLISLTPKARQQYHYTDQNVLRATSGTGPVTYRLAVCTAAGTRTYLTSATLPEDNVVLRSWDTIKLMFR
jgi:hypothetical protein